MEIDTSSAQPPVLDQDVFHDLHSMLGDDVYELIADFLNDIPTDLEKLRGAATASDPKALQAIAHYLKSCSGNLGIVHFADLCQQLENHAGAGLMAEACAGVAAVESEFAA